MTPRTRATIVAGLAHGLVFGVLMFLVGWLGHLYPVPEVLLRALAAGVTFGGLHVGWLYFTGWRKGRRDA